MDSRDAVDAVKAIVAMTLFIVGTVSLAISIGPLSNLFAEYQDSPTSTYLMFGGIPVLTGVGAFALGFFVLLSKPR